MKLRVTSSRTGGRIRIPASKSHTIRALFIAGLASGISVIRDPLLSDDARSAAGTIEAFGAEAGFSDGCCHVRGFSGQPDVPSDVISTGNSGTTLRLGVMTAALANGWTIFTGDHQIRSRPLKPLLDAVGSLGGTALSTRDNGMAPAAIKGRAVGGRTEIDAVTSQYLSSLLLHTPLLEKDTEIVVTRLNEKPYVDMTLWWLDRQGIRYHNEDFREFYIPGGQKYSAFDMAIPGDFSSAAFFLVQAAISGGEFTLDNLDMSDPQGDKLVISILRDMGARVSFDNGSLYIKGDGLTGREIDMNSIPDALPAMAVAGCFAEGETRLVNVPQARLKETDRISVMCNELRRMGADIQELPDGLVIRRSYLKGTFVEGHYDHRVVMALAVAGLNTEGETIIDTAEAMNVTFPEFARLMQDCGGNIELLDDENP